MIPYLRLAVIACILKRAILCYHTKTYDAKFMISTIFHTILYQPLLNALVFITNYIPGADIGIAVIVLTLIVKFILLPLTHKQIFTPPKM